MGSSITPEQCASIPVEVNQTRGGLKLTFDLAENRVAQSSSVWTTAGWLLRFVALPAGQTLSLDAGEQYLKVILGCEQERQQYCFTHDQKVRSTRIQCDAGHAPSITAGSAGLLGLLLTKTATAPANISAMRDVEFAGPSSEELNWRSFKERFGAFMPYFDTLDNHMADGFHLCDRSGNQICYVNFWTCGIHGDVSTHNHGQPPSALSPAFAEVHLVLNTGGSESGMYISSNPDDSTGTGEARQYIPMRPGEEHGPFFDHADGAPLLTENGAISYPWHGWESRGKARGVSAYDYVVAFEIYPEFARI